MPGWSDGPMIKSSHRDNSKPLFRFVRNNSKVSFRIVLVFEVKNANETLSGNLAYFQKATGARHAFQVVLEADYDGRDCFANVDPIVVSGKTFLSQLV